MCAKCELSLFMKQPQYMVTKMTCNCRCSSIFTPVFWAWPWGSWRTVWQTVPAWSVLIVKFSTRLTCHFHLVPQLLLPSSVSTVPSTPVPCWSENYVDILITSHAQEKSICKLTTQHCYWIKLSSASGKILLVVWFFLKKVKENSSRREMNSWPLVYKTSALTTELQGLTNSCLHLKILGRIIIIIWYFTHWQNRKK